MKNRKLYAFFCLLVTFSLFLTACAGEIEPMIADQKLPEETSVSPEETIDKQSEALTVYDPRQGGTVQEPDPQPTDAPITLPTEMEISIPGMIARSEFLAVRLQGVSGEKMKYLISKYLPPVGSSSTLSWAHITKADSLDKFLQEVDSNVFREACAPYDEEFFSQYDLIVIPRITNSGSVQHSAEQVLEDGELRVSVSVTEPEYSTAVMTNWLLVVPVAKADTQDVTITVGMDIADDLPMPTVGLGK